MTSTSEPYVGMCVGVAVRVGQHQQVDVHGVQQGGQRRVSTVVSGDLNEKHTSEERSAVLILTSLHSCVIIFSFFFFDCFQNKLN